MNFFVKSELNVLIIFLFLLVSAAAAYFYYNKSTLENYKRNVFTALRFFSVFFILLLIASPVISYIREEQTTPLHLILTDVSESTSLNNKQEAITEHLKMLSSSAPNGSETGVFAFSNGLLYEISGSEVRAETFSPTNLQSTLASISEKYQNSKIASLNIISDGIINKGGNPSVTALKLNAPINYILAGDTVQQNDAVLKSVSYNKSAFIESAVPVAVDFSVYQLTGEVTINLYEEDQLLESRKIIIQEGKNSYTERFKISSNTEGIKKYKAEIIGVDGEITLRNNSEEFFIKFVNNKMKVLVLTGAPSPDFSFIQSELKKISNFESEFRTQKSSSEFYEGSLPPLSDFNVFLLIGFPNSASPAGFMNDLKAVIETGNASLFFMSSKDTDYNKLMIIDDFLPFTAGNNSSNESMVSIRYVYSSVNDEIPPGVEQLSAVNSYPPVFKTSGSIIPKGGSETWMTTSDGHPVLMVSQSDKSSSAAFTAHGIYKWRLNNKELNSEETLRSLLTSVIVTIADKEKNKILKIETSQPVYSRSSPVEFIASLNELKLEGGEEVNVYINKDGFNKQIKLNETSNSEHNGAMLITENGDYSLRAELVKNGAVIDTDYTRFIIGQDNIEFKSTASERNLLNSLASITSGRDMTHMTADEINAYLSDLSSKSEEKITTAEIFRYNINPFVLVILIVLLCSEWFFRKRNNLP